MKCLARTLPLFLALCGCAHRPPPDAHVPPASLWVPGEQRSNVVMDPVLAGAMRVGKQAPIWTDDARLKVRTEFQNLTDRDLWVQFQIEFKDASGASTGDVTNWDLVRIDPMMFVTVEKTAMNEAAQNYIIRVRPAR